MNHPLVSVFVVTYNAGEYISETLDSIKAQTYNNIELIVSDDHSSDETVRLANEWIEKNKERFVRTEVITVDHNTGVSANYNRAVKACRGEWVKNVDGDDLITPNCIEKNLEFVRTNPEAEWVFSNVMKFKGKDVKKNSGAFFSEDMKKFFGLSNVEQIKSLLNKNILPSQSNFIKLILLQKNPYNEAYKGLEDAPMWLNLIEKGVKPYYFDVCTSYYRLDESMTSSKAKFFSQIYTESAKMFFWQEQFKLIKEYNLVEAYNTNRKFHLIIDFADGFLHNRKTAFNNFIFRIASRLIQWCTFFKL